MAIMKTVWLLVGRSLWLLLWPGLHYYLPRHQRARVAVRSDDTILLTKGWLSDGKWTLPGGGQRKHEASLSCAIRELQEETSILLAPDQLEYVASLNFDSHGLRFPYSLFQARVNEPLAVRRQPPEIADAQWIPIVSVGKYNAAPDVLAALHLLRW